MYFKNSLLLAGTIASSVMGAVLDVDTECGAPEPSEELLSVAREFATIEAQASAFASASASAEEEATVDVPVYVHVVASSESDSGYISESVVRQTIADMNGDYADYGFQYTIKDIDWTVNANWASDGDELAMKKKLRRGDYKTLNLYFMKKLRNNANGYCYFPNNVSEGSTQFYKDGCSVRATLADNRQTTTHEVGHWLGLFHTFQGGCQGDGDGVDDTPACEKTWSCDNSQDTCPGQPGNDAVNNFMAYGTCRREFTNGQGVRMRSFYNKFRA